MRLEVAVAVEVEFSWPREEGRAPRQLDGQDEIRVARLGVSSAGSLLGVLYEGEILGFTKGSTEWSCVDLSLALPGMRVGKSKIQSFGFCATLGEGGGRGGWDIWFGPWGCWCGGLRFERMVGRFALERSCARLTYL